MRRPPASEALPDRALAAPIERVQTSAYRIPTAAPESDGTLEWDSTTLVVAEVEGGGSRGLGYTYATTATATLIGDVLAPLLAGADAMAVSACWARMRHAIRNLGRPGIVSTAIAAVDVALWDLKAKLLGVPLVTLLGQVRDAVPVYGSGGFTSQTVDELRTQLGGWAADGIRMVKMKVGREPAADPERVRAARAAIGPDVALFVDANGAFTPQPALALAARLAERDVTWFEEPVSSDDLDGLRMVRERAPAGMEVAAGEYGYDLVYFHQMLDAGAVDVLQADATRCGGITELIRVSALCEARSLRMSTHTAPALHLHACCALPSVVHAEWFHDHARIENMLFDGVRQPRDGLLAPDLSRPGLGIELRRADAERYAV
jgi:L-alanine-DL-glutamate epimerase-like enolase superfamily enzyme